MKDNLLDIENVTVKYKVKNGNLFLIDTMTLRQSIELVLLLLLPKPWGWLVSLDVVNHL